MSPQAQEQFIPAPVDHRPDCCDFCGLDATCAESGREVNITNRCSPDGSVAEDCVNCERCWDFQNRFIVIKAVV